MTLYTAIFGPYDFVKPIFKKGNWNYVLFTDQPRNSPIFKYYDMYPELQGWDIRHVPTPKDPIREARKYKILPHRFLDGETIWIDSTFIPNTDCWPDGDFVVVNHPFERCVYREARACLDMGKGKAEEINRQVAHYKSLGIPTSSGVISSGILKRKPTQITKAMCDIWWDEIKNYSTRDQIGFGVVNACFNNYLTKIDWNYTTRSEFIHIPHISKEWGEDKLKQKICLHLGTK
jgi:hypothetical protein